MGDADAPGNAGWTVLALCCGLAGLGLMASNMGLAQLPDGWFDGTTVPGVTTSSTAGQRSGEGTSISTTSPAQPGLAEQPAPASCFNQVYGWSVEYPNGWYVADNGDPELACRLFDPDPIVVEFATSIDVAVRIESVSLGLDQSVGYALDDLSIDLLDRTDGEGAYGRTVSLRLVHDGTGFYDADVQEALVYVTWGESTLIVSAVAYPGESLEASAAVIERMAASLT